MDRSQSGATVPPRTGTHRVPEPAETSERPLTDLVSGLMEDLQRLMRAEFLLARAEMSEMASGAKRGAMLIGLAVLLLIPALMALTFAAIDLLDETIEEFWISAGAVGLVILVVAGLLALVGRSQIDLKPEQTIASLQEDKQWASQQIKSVQK